jgi:hypothetical protein
VRNVTSIRMSVNLWKAARVYALKHGTTLTQLIESLLEKELKKDPEVLQMVSEWRK